MQTAETKADIRAAVAEYRRAGESVGLVPTMGYLHEGHLSLVRAARAANDRTVVSIFVNPTQFGPREDLATYPRDIERDLDLLRREGVDAVFLPSVDEMYHPDRQTIVETTRLSRVLMGRLRPGHYRGVATVVTKLFNIVQPDAAYFGEKDYQQLCVIRAMVRDLDSPVAVHGVPTVREADGLAMSSRNVRLSAEDRAAAPVLNASLDAAERIAATGARVSDIKAAVRGEIDSEPRAGLQSVDIRDAQTLAPVQGVPSGPLVVLLAARFGDVLLIDQRVVTPKGKT
ncbi:pantoate--beta-alanine ligase [Tranquillimonas rosea]|uniref:pantoate--beta-alanine ligase n=1 Tax=Tranquillimonas rosea TaxID=641238 RepID=UPI003BAB7A7E